MADASDRVLWLAIRQALIIMLRAIELRLNIQSCITTRAERDRADQILLTVPGVAGEDGSKRQWRDRSREPDGGG